ncbi:hypothetical protein C8F04DRAFT_1191853 [Mycena alexandri]|uniref:Uncharacterized protein n=1 Tax=Mycena alexandri TaxID=1745969 RepID=A0AAD6SFD8_9AGAR|nr:hypothetical protein C8F04DRAFT_1191853 [Mycena alexandri]
MSSITQSFPTTSNGELATAGELTTTTTLTEIAHACTHAEKQAQQEAAEDLLLANNYFERIGRRQRIHEYAVHRHLKLINKSSLRMVIETFNSLHESESQVPPPLGAFDAKAAIARGRAIAFSEGTTEAERAWAYGHTNEFTDEATWADEVTSKVLMTTEGRRRDVLEDYHRSSDTGASNFEEAKLALERIQSIARRLRPKRECEFSEVAPLFSFFTFSPDFGQTAAKVDTLVE